MQRTITALALAVAVLGVATGVIVAQSNQTVEVRIQAMRLEDGRVEFALQQREGDGWGERVLPRARYFPTTSEGRWLSSSPVEVAVPVSAATTPTPVPTATPTTTSGTFEGRGQLGETAYWTNRDELTDELTTFLMVVTPYTDDYGLNQSASVVVTCDDSTGRRGVWLSSDEYHSRSSKVTVTYRIDTHDAVSGRWEAFGDLGKAVTPSILNTTARDAFIDEMHGGSTLRIRTTATPVLTFDVSELFNTPAQVNIDRCGE